MFSRMVPKTREEKKSNTVANNPNRKRSRWRDGTTEAQRKKHKHKKGPNAELGDAAYDPADEGKIAAQLLKWNEDWSIKKKKDEKAAENAARRQATRNVRQATPAFSPMSFHDASMAWMAGVESARPRLRAKTMARTGPSPTSGHKSSPVKAKRKAPLPSLRSSSDPARAANTALLRLHYDDDRKGQLDARYLQSPAAMSPMSLHARSLTAANAPRGKRVPAKKGPNEELGEAAYDPADHAAIAAHVAKSIEDWTSKIEEDKEREVQSPGTFSPASLHAASVATANAYMARKQSGQGRERSMLTLIGSMSGLDYGQSRNLQDADLVSWEN